MSNICIKPRFEDGSAVLQNTCNFHDISDRKPVTPPSNYTSQGKRKATPCDPVRKVEHIVAITEYFRTHGRNTKRNYMIWVLGVSIGIRGKDLLNIKIKDVLHSNGYIADSICVNESKTRKMNYPFINDAAKLAIADYLNSLKSYSPEDYLIHSEGKPQMDGNTLYNIMRDVQKALDLPYHLGAHSLRKTFAYWTIALHGDDAHVMNSLQEMLNHDSIKTTLYYSGHTRDHIRTMYEDMEKLFTGEAETVTSNTISTEDQIAFIYGKIQELCPEIN